MHEATVYGESVLLIAGSRPQLTDRQLRDERGVIRKNAQLAIRPGRQHYIHLASEQLFAL
jgi:hypothetical protein